MILIRYAGVDIPAEDNGSLIDPPIYWKEDILNDIAEAYALGEGVGWKKIEVDDSISFQPDWKSFVEEFTNPFNSLYNDLYNATASLVQQSSSLTIEHWQNIRIGLASQLFWDITKFQSSITYLNNLLLTDNHPLTQTQKQAWIDLAAQFDIPLEL